ncbi:MAG: SCO family protein [Gammaproteobacteria bacterium]|nr:SCO family protein [Gammaproteobacteria bacterium]
MNIPRAQLLIVALALAAAVAGFVVARGMLPAPPAAQPELHSATLLNAPRPLPDFSLLDQHGEVIGPEVFTGDWQLVFFGFTNCPDICPMTLHTLTAVRAKLASQGRQQPGVVFVSVDPERDAPAQLADYLAYFDTSIVGITGDQEGIAKFARDMGVAVFMGAEDDHGHYNVDHSTAVFLVDPAGRLSALFRMPHEVDVMADEFTRIVETRVEARG